MTCLFAVFPRYSPQRFPWNFNHGSPIFVSRGITEVRSDALPFVSTHLLLDSAGLTVREESVIRLVLIQRQSHHIEANPTEPRPRLHSCSCLLFRSVNETVISRCRLRGMQRRCKFVTTGKMHLAHTNRPTNQPSTAAGRPARIWGRETTTRCHGMKSKQQISR